MHVKECSREARLGSGSSFHSLELDGTSAGNAFVEEVLIALHRWVACGKKCN